MTNAEKFKEVFGYDIDIDAMTICPFKNVETACLDRDVPCRECLDDYWYNKEYQGEPTIPLSVLSMIGKIKKGIHKEITSGGKWNGGWYDVTEKYAIEKFDAIIDEAVKECTHDKG